MTNISFFYNLFGIHKIHYHGLTFLPVLQSLNLANKLLPSRRRIQDTGFIRPSSYGRQMDGEWTMGEVSRMSMCLKCDKEAILHGLCAVHNKKRCILCGRFSQGEEVCQNCKSDLDRPQKNNQVAVKLLTAFKSITEGILATLEN